MTLRLSTWQRTDTGCTTTFNDGTSWSAYPHATADYREVTRRCGYGDDPLAYCAEHDLCHLIVSERIGGRECPVLWDLAHGREPDKATAAQVEALVQVFQRWLRADEQPILIAGIDWWGMKQEALEMLG